MRVISYDYTKHYETLCNWWKAHDWTPLPAEYLPRGFVAELDNGKPVAAGFVYENPSKLFITDWLVSDPNTLWMTRKRSIHAIMKAIGAFSQEMGATALVTFSKNNRLTEKLVESGFQVTDKNMDVLIRRI